VFVSAKETKKNKNSKKINIWFLQEVLFWTSNFHFQILWSLYISNMSRSWATLRNLWLYRRPSHCSWKDDASFFMQITCLYAEDYLHAIHNDITSLNSNELFMK
jgi:hypothetical protein